MCHFNRIGSVAWCFRGHASSIWKKNQPVHHRPIRFIISKILHFSCINRFLTISQANYLRTCLHLKQMLMGFYSIHILYIFTFYFILYVFIYLKQNKWPHSTEHMHIAQSHSQKKLSKVESRRNVCAVFVHDFPQQTNFSHFSVKIFYST